MATKIEWAAILKLHRYKCVICGLSEKKLGGLDQAHLKARSKGGSQVLPMCPNCHQRFDKILFTQSECKRIGIDYRDYIKEHYAPRRRRRTSREDDGFWPFN